MEQEDEVRILECVNSGMYHVATDTFMRELRDNVTLSTSIMAESTAERDNQGAPGPAGWTKVTADWLDTLQAPAGRD